MMAAVDVPTYQESSMDQDDIAFPCKGCGEVGCLGICRCSPVVFMALTFVFS